ncbi:bifunctional folylpolyglutamate synthase/dihydrofolate synthase [Spiroplasma endosymbiont of Crioceris asparagi]|uniref:bifunctional folylpolyglutamate synthase/dihydrofolate synthase n=1 Tax=Spiroplasma endosymbiont of Crioceris asparagi TaxID=3066286 RepID=UPI0030CF3936
MISVNENIFPKNNLFAKEYNLKKLLIEVKNNSQNNFEVINVVGTNGKGSTSTILADAMQTKYKKVGLFISPAFLNHNERISINGKCISDEELKNTINLNKELIKTYNLTFFEIWTLIAIDYFNKNKIDIAIIEAGIGGLYDSTNVFENQKLVAITSISLDHVNVFGNSIEEIIKQKIGIVKNKNKIFLANSNLKYKDFIKKEFSDEKIIFSEIDDLQENHFQKDNVGLVKAIVKYLNIKYDFKNIKFPLGRYSVLRKKPFFVIDGAHNEEAFKILSSSIKETGTIVLVGLSDAKKVTMAQKYFSNNLYFTNFENFKAADLSKIKDINFVNDWKQFLIKNINQNILVCGSLYFVPQVYEWFNKIKDKI